MVFDEGLKASHLMVVVLLGCLLYMLFVLIACAAGILKNVVKGKNPLEGVWVPQFVESPEPVRTAFEDTSR